MRYVSLTTEQSDQLTGLYKSSPNHRERQRAHALLVSHRHYTIPTSADLFEVDRDTVSRWLDRWDQTATNPIAGPLTLQDQARPGRPTQLNDTQKKQ